MGSLAERISNTVATDMYQRAMALISAGPKIRAAEYLEERLNKCGLDAAAVGNINMANGGTVSVHVLCYADESDIGDAMIAHDIAFDRVHVRGQDAVHFDCNIGSYNIVLLAFPPMGERQVA
jgi:hypothetical protein